MPLWKSESRFAELGIQSTQPCPHCKLPRPFRLTVAYTVHSVLLYLRWVPRQHYQLVCNTCRRGKAVETSAALEMLGHSPIPWFNRLGWLLLIPLVVAGVAVHDHLQPAADTLGVSLLDDPAAGDLYVVDLASASTAKSGAHMYGVLRVKSVEVERVEFLAPNFMYGKATRAVQDIDRGRPSTSAYFSPEPRWFTRDELATLRADGMIHAVRR